MNPAEQAALSFCSTLFPDPDPLDGYEANVLTLTPTGQVRGVRWLPVDPAAIASAVVEENTAEGVGAVYLSVGVLRPNTPRRKPDGKLRRAENGDIGAIVGVWADIDIASPAHTGGKRLPPDLDAVRKILAAAGLRPTMIVDTGHGIHAYWLFPEPLVFADEPDPEAAAARAAAAVRNWQLTLAAHAHRLGRWQIDMTHDLTRVLRAPGSTNRKTDDHRAVKVTEIDETARYELDEIEAHTADPAFLATFAGMPTAGGEDAIGGDVLLAVWGIVRSREYRDRGYVPEWLAYALDEGIVKADDKLVKVWRQGHESGDASTTDISLARFAANLGLDERDAAEIIMCYRLRTNHKVEKVDPTRRRSYLQSTIGKAFKSYREQRAEVEKLTADAHAASARMKAEAQARADAGTPPPAPRRAEYAVDPAEEAESLGESIAANLADRAAVVDPMPEAESPAADTPPAPPVDPPDDAPRTGGPDDPSDPEPTPLRPVGPGSNAMWGTRPAAIAAELDELSKVLLGDLFPRVRIWRCFTRGRGSKQERFLQMRFDRDFAWLGVPPVGYHSGIPFNTGTYPAQTFNKLAGWLSALELDCRLNTAQVQGDAFALRFRATLVQVWEPDDTSGALANIVRDALHTYLLDFPLVSSWTDAAAQGMPVITQDRPQWVISTPFAVMIRWPDFCRFVRSQYGILTTPPVMAEMADYAGALVAPTLTQQGRWRIIRRDYFTDGEWAAILQAGRNAEQQREDRHGMTVVPGGQAGDGAEWRAGSRDAGSR